MITEPDLVEAVRKQARLYPDRLYQTADDPILRCAYTPNALNACGCIVGEALASLGVSEDRLRSINSAGSWACAGTLGKFERVLGHLVSGGALRSVWVARVQQHQDEGETWRRAVELADQRTGAPA